MLKIKEYILSLLLVFCFGLLTAQAVPNFIGKDIDGVEHNLHAYLDEGKVVIVEVFATWCTSCWAGHKSDLLKNLYKTYGPNGTDQLQILFIEGDEETNLESLYGTSSFGDWTEGVSYPIFSPDFFSNEFKEAFAADGFPTLNVVCPLNKEIIADVYQNELSEIIDIIQECNTIEEVSDLQILEGEDKNIGICSAQDILIDVLNSGTETMNSFLLEAKFPNGEIINTHNCEVELRSGELITVNLGDYQIPTAIDSQLVQLSIMTADDVLTNNDQEITFVHALEVENQLTLYLDADGWAYNDNTRWWVENSLGEKVIPETKVEESYAVEIPFFLENNDCFTFVIAEDFGDGMLFGKVRLTSSSGEVLYDNADFNKRGEASFEYLGTVTSNQDILPAVAYDLSIVPNIVDQNLSIAYKLPNQQDVSFTIFDLQGKRIHSQIFGSEKGDHSSSIDVSAFSNGLYLLQMQTAEGMLTQKFTKL